MKLGPPRFRLGAQERAESAKSTTPAGRSPHRKAVIDTGLQRPWPSFGHFPYKRDLPPSGPTMSALANRPFVKMNGLGNEIVVVDMRNNPAAISADDARAAAQPAGAPYDQLMALYPPRMAGTDVARPHLQQRRLGGRRLRQRHALRRLADRPGERQGPARLRGRRPRAQHLEGRRRAVHRRHGRAALCLERDSARRGIPRHPRHRIADRPDRQADPAFAVGGQHGQSARDLLGRRRQRLRPRQDSARCWRTIRSFRSAPTSRCAPSSRRSTSSSAPGSAAPA